MKVEELKIGNEGLLPTYFKNVKMNNNQTTSHQVADEVIEIDEN